MLARSTVFSGIPRSFSAIPIALFPFLGFIENTCRTDDAQNGGNLGITRKRFLWMLADARVASRATSRFTCRLCTADPPFVTKTQSQTTSNCSGHRTLSSIQKTRMPLKDRLKALQEPLVANSPSSDASSTKQRGKMSNSATTKKVKSRASAAIDEELTPLPTHWYIFFGILEPIRFVW